MTKTGTATKSIIKKSGAATVSEEHSDEVIAGETLTIEPFAEVGFSAKRVINMGNYEAVHIAISIKLPCHENQIKRTYMKAKEFVELRLEAEVEELDKLRIGEMDI